MPYQSMVTAYRPLGTAIDLGELDAFTFSWDSWGAFSDTASTSLTDLAIIAAVESTKPLGTVVWLRILDNPLIYIQPSYIGSTFTLGQSQLYNYSNPV